MTSGKSVGFQQQAAASFSATAQPAGVISFLYGTRANFKNHSGFATGTIGTNEDQQMRLYLNTSADTAIALSAAYADEAGYVTNSLSINGKTYNGSEGKDVGTIGIAFGGTNNTSFTSGRLIRYDGSKLCDSGVAISDSVITPITQNTSSLGTATTQWNTAYITTIGSGTNPVTTIYATTIGSSSKPVTDIYGTTLHGQADTLRNTITFSNEENGQGANLATAVNGSTQTITFGQRNENIVIKLSTLGAAAAQTVVTAISYADATGTGTTPGDGTITITRAAGDLTTTLPTTLRKNITGNAATASKLNNAITFSDSDNLATSDFSGSVTSTKSDVSYDGSQLAMIITAATLGAAPAKTMITSVSYADRPTGSTAKAADGTFTFTRAAGNLTVTLPDTLYKNINGNAATADKVNHSLTFIKYPSDTNGGTDTTFDGSGSNVQIDIGANVIIGEFSLASGGTKVTVTHNGIITGSGIVSYVANIVITSGAEYMSGPFSSTISNKKAILTCSATTGDVSGYVVIVRGLAGSVSYN